MAKILKNNLLGFIRKHPKLQMRLSGLNRLLGRTQPPAFSGWGMTTESSPPWVAGKSAIDREFAAAAKALWDGISSGRFIPSQFLSVPDLQGWMEQLMWRHYIVFWSASYAARGGKAGSVRLVECGVCDGVTSYFACQATNRLPDWQMFLYDAWEVMLEKQLLPSEASVRDTYSYLSLENTQRNLADFQDHLIFTKGYLPESFRAREDHGRVCWLHIDLNSAQATTEVLKYLYDKVADGGVILFDDYGVAGYSDTRLAVDEFFGDKAGTLLPMPTGQAMFFKRA